ncbi:MAG: hypothetical protein AAF682_10020 [Planctomycetota bacterium]
MILRPRTALTLASLLLSACGGGAEGAEPASPHASTPPSLAPFELRDTLAACPAPAEASDDDAEVDEAARAEAEGLAILVTSDAGMLQVARDDVARLGDDATAALVALARDGGRPDRERASALDLIDLASERGADGLLSLASDAEPGWMRARAAWRLAEDGPDRLLPALVLRLKYERDHETVVWLAVALARHGNLAGLDGLIAIAGNAQSPAQSSAQRELSALLARFGQESATDLWRAWRRPADERDFAPPARSPALRAALCGWVARLNEFQLRGVDDARFLLQRMDVAAVDVLGEALHDRDVYVRVHAAQCLQRMGRRAAGAGAELLAALGDPELAPHAAVALGQVDHGPAAEVLADLLHPDTAPGLRLACARALGYLSVLSPRRAAAVLSPLLDAEPAELAQAAAESLVRADPDAEEVALRLTVWLEDERVDPASSERALRDWLYARDAGDLLARWDALAPPGRAAEEPSATRARRAARAELVRAHLAR